MKEYISRVKVQNTGLGLRIKIFPLYVIIALAECFIMIWG